MFKKILEYSGVLALLVIILAIFFGTTKAPHLGNATASFVEADGGFYVGNIPFVVPGATNTFPTIFTGNFIQGMNGWSLSLSTSTTLTPAQFCTSASQLVINATAVTTTTLPAATSTYVACGSPALGSYSQQLFDNESTSSANVIAGTGQTFRCETNGVGTTTVLGGCTASQVTINATSSAWVSGFWTASGTQVLIWGNEYH